MPLRIPNYIATTWSGASSFVHFFHTCFSRNPAFSRCLRAEIPPRLYAWLRSAFDEDLRGPGSWLGAASDCESFHEVASGSPRWWRRSSLVAL